MTCGTAHDTLDTLNALVADQQRVWDAILTGVVRPFARRELPWFGEFLRWS